MLWGSSSISNREESTAKYNRQGWELGPDLMTYTARTERGQGRWYPRGNTSYCFTRERFIDTELAKQELFPIVSFNIVMQSNE